MIINNVAQHKSAKIHLKSDPELITEVGLINSFSYKPSESMETHTNEHGTTGNANLTLIIKGVKKYVEKDVVMLKETGNNWEIVSVK